ncbi:MAG TPA: hypothetical protein VJ624_11695 [Thermodesulfobacteriota bacterium]|nr:hypothetical protein [Thermodesulfobacteriota bacterium]
MLKVFQAKDRIFAASHASFAGDLKIENIGWQKFIKKGIRVAVVGMAIVIHHQVEVDYSVAIVTCSETGSIPENGLGSVAVTRKYLFNQGFYPGRGIP